MTITTQSVVIIAPAASKADGDLALACYYGDELGAANLGLKVSANGQLPATHYMSHIWLDPARATAIKDWPSGILPTPNGQYGYWEDYQLTEASALAVGQTFIVSVMAASDDNFQTMPQTNVASVLTALGLQRIL
jgi:streptogramin lyase